MPNFNGLKGLFNKEIAAANKFEKLLAQVEKEGSSDAMTSYIIHNPEDKILEQIQILDQSQDARCKNIFSKVLKVDGFFPALNYACSGRWRLDILFARQDKETQADIMAVDDALYAIFVRGCGVISDEGKVKALFGEQSKAKQGDIMTANRAFLVLNEFCSDKELLTAFDKQSTEKQQDIVINMGAFRVLKEIGFDEKKLDTLLDSLNEDQRQKMVDMNNSYGMRNIGIDNPEQWVKQGALGEGFSLK